MAKILTDNYNFGNEKAKRMFEAASRPVNVLRR